MPVCDAVQSSAGTPLPGYLQRQRRVGKTKRGIRRADRKRGGRRKGRGEGQEREGEQLISTGLQGERCEVKEGICCWVSKIYVE